MSGKNGSTKTEQQDIQTESLANSVLPPKGSIRLDKTDVILADLETEICNSCGEQPAVCYIEIDLRVVGGTVNLGNWKFCRACGEKELADIQTSMPEPLNEDGTF